MANKKYKNPAIVVGGGVNGLGIIRCLGKKGVDVYCAIDKKDEAVYSKYCKKCFVVPGVEHDLEILRKFLTDFEKRLKYRAVLFPVSDISILNVSALIDEMDNYCISISDKKILETIIKKKNFYQSLKEKETPHPKTIILNGPDNLEDISDITKFPVFVKPSMSQIFLEKFGGKKAFIADSEDELRKYVGLAKRHNIDVVIQEIVIGRPTNHLFIDGYFNKNSKPTALFARRRIRMWPQYYGNSTVCESIPISDADKMKDIVVNYLSSIGFQGIFSAEFKVDERDGIAKLLEINARSWWYNAFPANCGIDIIFMAYLEAIGEEITPIFNYESGKYLIYLLEDFNWALSAFFHKNFSLGKWLLPLKKKKNWAVFSGDDLKPFIVSIFKSLRAAFLTLVKF